MRRLFLIFSHLGVFVAGFALGIYLLPILIAEKAPLPTAVLDVERSASFRGEFRTDLKGSDLLHWGEGEVFVTPKQIAHRGRLAPGPDYKLYLAPAFVDDEASFLAIKEKSLRISDVKGFSGFIAPVPEGVDVGAYTTVVIWCERFGEFISAAKYR
ncbi:MAG: DM13 domain-containing protein [Beijerinckiaceae bacterium]|jgi:hypothetical protein|nr:DM13 domain-containing protein [Beijerinckiaceae bacterium]